jgi:ketosteroid isomerase-like protein
METAETRTLIETYYATLPTGDREKLLSLLSDDVEMVPPESTGLETLKGPEAVAAAMGGDLPRKMFKMRTFKLTVRHTTVDGDTAVVQQAISAETRDGNQYDNEYCWVYTCRDGRIARMVEYADTLKASRILPIG